MSKPTTFEEAVDEVMGELRELMINKQRDYGHSNITDFGEYGVLVRLNDKVCRLKNLLGNKKEPKNESIDDSWMIQLITLLLPSCYAEDYSHYR